VKLLERILAPGGIRCFGQGIYRLHSREARLHGVELLSRGPADTSFEPPSVLFDYARRKRAEARVDRRAIEVALQASAAFLGDTCVSLNVHASTFGRDPSFVSWLLSSAHQVGIQASQLTIEIIEHTPIWNRPEFALALQRLREAGSKIALDDLGVGFSNFQMILDARPDILKADRYLITTCDQDPNRRTMLGALRDIADQLGAKVVAEGVETAAELITMQQLGIELVQGYFLGRAVPIEQFAQLPRSQYIPFPGAIRQTPQDASDCSSRLRQCDPRKLDQLLV
jgi:EAL domain-containing protein (putative c-di-GMP-specific phosphodiesterase class I)